MKNVLGSQLPSFTAEQKKAIKGSVDFFGLNYYTSHYVRGEGPYNVSLARC
jgi:beta-glucosidase/6-phospho-beta-glucosidase/beta-galactosidase